MTIFAKRMVVMGGLASMMILLNGCSSKQEGCSLAPQQEFKDIKKVTTGATDQTLNVPSSPFKPIIGTRNDDAKTIIDMGVVLKVYIASYKDSKRKLVAGHDTYVIARDPSFIVGTQRPDINKRTGIITPAGKVPFIFGNEEIDRSLPNTNEQIKTFVDTVHETERNATQAFSQMESESEKLDSKITDFLKSQKY